MSDTKTHRSPARRAARGGASLRVAHPSISVVELRARGEQPLGREQLCARDDEISTRHAQITADADGYSIVDLRSRNGTFVQGARLEPGRALRLVDGDILRFGATLAVFRSGALPPPCPPTKNHGGPFGQAALEQQLRALARLPELRFVLVRGETGAGKEDAARQIAARLRPRGPLVVTNVAQLGPSTFHSELFGHARGSYTSAHTAHRGLLLDAGAGAIVLDELAELTLEQQVVMLRAIENAELTPVGGDPTRHGALIIGTTNRDLEVAVATGALRADFAARLKAAVVRLAPLRERAEDIPSIAVALAARVGIELDAEVEALEHLMRLPLLENARELARIVASASDVDGRLHQRDVGRLAGPPPALDLSRVHDGAYASDRALARAAGISRRQAMKVKRAPR